MRAVSPQGKCFMDPSIPHFFGVKLAAFHAAVLDCNLEVKEYIPKNCNPRPFFLSFVKIKMNLSNLKIFEI
jgi:hypothetical protein